jgi:hypothetical protein
MSRAARRPKTKAELEQMSLEAINAELKYLRARQRYAGNATVAQWFDKEIVAAETVRLRRFGIRPRG